MKITPALFLVSLFSAALCGLPSAQAGCFKRISIDGTFTDWAGVPPAYVDPQDAPDGFDFRRIYVANDENYLYVRVKIDQPRDFASFHHQVIIDADADSSTGLGWAGVGSELLVEDGAPWQQKNGAFNEGAGSGLDWMLAPTGMISEFEARISRDVRDNGGQPVFQQNAIALAFRVVNLGWDTTIDVAPDNEGIPYEFAPAPAKATGARGLISLAGTTWHFQDTGIDPGSDWLMMDYDDSAWKSGPGLFGFGSPVGSYPAPVKTPLTAGRSAYYFRAPFTWEFDSTGIALVVSNYVSDGAVLYLNGAEVKRLRLPAGPITYSTLATGGPEQPGHAEVFSLPPSALVTGTNLLEVEVHATAGTPQALAFGLELFASDSLPPSIEDPTQPADQTVVEGQSTTFSVGQVAGTLPLYYMWSKDGAPIPDATNTTYTIPVVLVTDAGSYNVEISNAAGTKVTSRSARLTTTATPVTIVDPGQPSDRTVEQGKSTTFAFQVTGSPVISFLWFKDGAAIDGATNTQLTLDNPLITDAGNYSVTASNRLGGVTSRTARLTVTADQVPPEIAQVTGSGTKVIVTFSEVVDSSSAVQTANYSLNNGAAIQNATLDPADSRTVTLITTPLQFGTNYTLRATGVKDRYDNASNSSAPFRASINIDGNFDDWAGIPVLDTEPQDTAEGLEFKEISAANDSEFLYLRFSFYSTIGQLPVDYYYHIFFDTDNDPATGMPTAGLGSEMMIENGGGFQQKNGSFNEGTVRDMAFVLAPAAKASEFECRISLKSAYTSDGTAVFSGRTVALAFQLVNTSWSAVETVPQGNAIVFSMAEVPPSDLAPIKVEMVSGKIQISWTGPGTLQSRDSLSSGLWTTVPDASSPYSFSPTGQQRYYRLTL